MGGSKSSSPPAPVASPQEVAQQQIQAQLNAIPQAAQIQFDLLKDPNIGLKAQTQLAEDVRGDVFTGESGVRDQLLQNILGQLQSPTGLTPEQTTAQEAIRGREVERQQRNVRLRGELGGNLFGGRNQLAEERSGEALGQKFAAEDIDRQERNRLNAINAALPALQILFPELGLTSPQFINPVPGANQTQQTNVQQRGQDIGLQQSELARQSALQTALFSSLGQAAGGATSLFG